MITRPQHTETQTKKGRIERWKNIEGKFQLLDPVAIQNKHLLLVDDVVTTGATLEACGNELLTAENVKLSVATLCSRQSLILSCKYIHHHFLFQTLRFTFDINEEPPFISISILILLMPARRNLSLQALMRKSLFQMKN